MGIRITGTGYIYCDPTISSPVGGLNPVLPNGIPAPSECISYWYNELPFPSGTGGATFSVRTASPDNYPIFTVWHGAANPNLNINVGDGLGHEIIVQGTGDLKYDGDWHVVMIDADTKVGITPQVFPTLIIATHDVNPVTLAFKSGYTLGVNNLPWQNAVFTIGQDHYSHNQSELLQCNNVALANIWFSPFEDALNPNTYANGGTVTGTVGSPFVNTGYLARVELDGTVVAGYPGFDGNMPLPVGFTLLYPNRGYNGPGFLPPGGAPAIYLHGTNVNDFCSNHSNRKSFAQWIANGNLASTGFSFTDVGVTFSYTEPTLG